ncbi:hypothetical protein BH11MYX4_BH11MYX4_61520 [soil metagenome]
MLHRTLTIAAVAAVALAATACGSSAPPEGAHIRGTVSGLSTQNGRAVAVTSQGKSYWAALDKTGAFDLALPAGVNARVYVVNAPAAGRHPVAGHLVGAGAKKWIVTSSGTTQLGAVRPAGAPSPATGTTTKSDAPTTGGADDADEKAEDASDDSHEDDGEKGNLCGADTSTDVELHAESAPAASDDADDKGEKDKEDEGSRKDCGG